MGEEGREEEGREVRKWLVATALLIVVRIAVGFWIAGAFVNGFGDVNVPGILGTVTGTLVLGVVPATVYWFLSGRRKSDGRTEAARLLFWCSFLLPLLPLMFPTGRIK